MLEKVLVTGASGTIGYEVYRELLRRKERYSIRILSLERGYERRLFLPMENEVEIVWGDICDFRDMQRAINGVDSVIHTAGIIPPLADQKPQLAHDVNVEGTRNLIRAMSVEDPPPKIVFTSSISVYGDRLTNPNILVEDPLKPSDGDEYARTKITAEQIIQDSRVPWLICRLCGILGKTLKIQPLMFHMPLDTSLEWCHPEDVGYALVEALDHESVFGKIFNLGGGENCRILARDFVNTMLNLWGLALDILPKYAFATQNFHSGYYLDGYKLNDILNFQRRTLEDYVDIVRTKVSSLQKLLVRSIPKRIIRYWLVRMSEPLRAIRENDEILIRRYYGSRQKFNEIRSTENNH